MNRLGGAINRIMPPLLIPLLVFALIIPSLTPQVSAPAAPASGLASGASAGMATCLGRLSETPIFSRTYRLAVIKPVFTSTPYSQYPFDSFYAFYTKYKGVSGNVTSDLRMLHTNVQRGEDYVKGWGRSYPLFAFLTSPRAKECGLSLGTNLIVVSDIEVDQGALFLGNGSRRFDAVVAGHEEYATQNEYTQLQSFVSSGGRLVLMSGDVFRVEVSYSSVTGNETLVAGHGWTFDGKAAVASTVDPFASANADWVGSSYCCGRGRITYSGGLLNSASSIGAELRTTFGSRAFVPYDSHEEDSLQNSSGTSVIATFWNASGLSVVAYSHHYRGGYVVCLCIFGEDIIGFDSSTQFFLIYALTFNLAQDPPSTAIP